MDKEIIRQRKAAGGLIEDRRRAGLWAVAEAAACLGDTKAERAGKGDHYKKTDKSRQVERGNVGPSPEADDAKTEKPASTPTFGFLALMLLTAEDTADWY